MAEITREELLSRYIAGERNFSGLDLSGIDLTNAQLQSIRFSKWMHECWVSFCQPNLQILNINYQSQLMQSCLQIN